MNRIVLFGAVCLLLASSAVGVGLYISGRFYGSTPAPMSYEELTGSLFLPAPKEPFRTPTVQELRLPPIENATSVWGAIGRDIRGHIWVGVSATSDGMSAHLLEYDPDADAWRDRGAVTERLRQAGLYRKGEGQIKIHSRIVAGGDGWLYFASTDEEGERADLSRPPDGALIYGVFIRTDMSGSIFSRYPKGWWRWPASAGLSMPSDIGVMSSTGMTRRAESHSK